ncbi:right-handed parallel beta-helix repeat-containing protein [Paenibacillus mendelii]|uniref:Nitrous oxide reductase family maturation protein NosD n=1 Tax=Paenibacillus mendelii TaxID=206163 RepID=A0ABV6JJS7_9BACL|nr:NosD domain-containing protein [Paenibacillus mendelii]MCQ6558872.1 right-handed parallel beta-helix repeat-containing protein [Paenibacillus mendelii]
MHTKQGMRLVSRPIPKGSRRKIWVMLLSWAAVASIMVGVPQVGVLSKYFEANKLINVVEDSKAKGDGVTDDTAAIQRAIDKVVPGGTVVIPKGSYYISAASSSKAVTGYGASQFAFKITKPMTVIMEGAEFKTKTKNNHGVFWIYRTSDVLLQGGSIKGDVRPTDGILTSRVGILVQESKHVTIEDMHLANLSQGINLTHSEKSIVRNVTAESNRGSGIINFISKYSIIEGNTIRNSGDGHLSLYGGGRNNTVINNTIVENRSAVTHHQGITLEKERDSVIKNNTVKGFYYGIDIKNGTNSCLIEGNIAFNNQYNIAIRPGDGGGNMQETSEKIRLYRNTATNQKKMQSSVAGILITVGKGHIVQENTIDQDGLLLKGGVKLNRNIDLNGIKFIDNVFVPKKE